MEFKHNQHIDGTGIISTLTTPLWCFTVTYLALTQARGSPVQSRAVRTSCPSKAHPQVRAVLHMVAVSSVSCNRAGTYKNPVLAGYYEEKCVEKPKRWLM